MAETVKTPVKLPHQKVLEAHSLDYKVILSKGDQLTLTRIEARYKKAWDIDDEEKQKSEIAAATESSEKLAGAILEYIKEKADTAAAALEVETNFNTLIGSGEQLFTEKNYTAALQAFTDALALGFGNEAAQAGIDKANVAIAAEAHNDAVREYNNYMQSGQELLLEGNFADALPLFEKALATNVANEEAQKMVDAAKAVKLISEKAVIVQAVVKDIDNIIKTKGQITDIELKDLGVTNYDATAATIKIGDLTQMGAEIDLIKSEEGVYKLFNAPALPKKNGTNYIAWGIALLLGGTAIALAIKNRKAIAQFFNNMMNKGNQAK